MSAAVVEMAAVIPVVCTSSAVDKRCRTAGRSRKAGSIAEAAEPER